MFLQITIREKKSVENKQRKTLYGSIKDCFVTKKNH